MRAAGDVDDNLSESERAQAKKEKEEQEQKEKEEAERVKKEQEAAAKKKQPDIGVRRSKVMNQYSKKKTASLNGFKTKVAAAAAEMASATTAGLSSL